MKKLITMLCSVWLPGITAWFSNLIDQRLVRWSFYLLAIAFFLIRYFYLTADFPNYSIWMIDQAKFTDEGWWSSAAVMHFLTGHWDVPGDYNPGVAQPVWPLLLGTLFSFTGVSIAAARAFNVTLSIAAACAASSLIASESRRYAPLAFLLLAASPFAYVFSRLAILDTLITLEFCCLLLLAARLQKRQLLGLASIALLSSAMLLSKLTSALLLPAVLWMAWWTMSHNWRSALKSITAVILVPTMFFKAWEVFVTHCGYGADYHYFYDNNAMEDFDWSRIGQTLADLARHGFMIDRLLYPTLLIALIILLLASFPFWPARHRLSLRPFFTNPLFAASTLAIAAEALYIIRRQDDFAPRYLLVMLAPLVLIALILLARLFESRSPFAPVLLLIMLASVLANGIMIEKFITRPTYQFIHAADAIGKIVRSTPGQNPLIFGVSASQLSLMNGIPSINDAYSLEEMPEKVARYKPGWYLVWNAIAESNADLLTPYTLEKVATYAVFDDDDRNHLILYRMIPRR